MGFFSYNCKVCGHPALCEQAADREINGWMTDCIVLFENGDRCSGKYDGYGRVGRYSAADEDQYDGPPCLYHLACWEVAGKPAHSGPSTDTDDQGWFFNDGDHDMLDPRVEHAPAALALAQAARDGRKRGITFRQKDEDADDGTYRELHRLLVIVPARAIASAEERVAIWGYDPLKYADEYEEAS